jgi:hypothetical protein
MVHFLFIMSLIINPNVSASHYHIAKYTYAINT